MKLYKLIVAIVIGVLLVTSMPVFTAEAKTNNIVVVIDAGHSGSDCGAVGRFGGKTVNERDTNMQIALAMKKELQKYDGVTVKMTRTDATTDWTISSRVKKTMEMGGDIYIALHNNASYSHQSNGALVIVSNGNYRSKLAKLEKGLGKLVLEELVKSNKVKNQGLLIRNASTSRYPNGAVADYYQLTREPTEYGIPAITIEHGYIDNAIDYKKCFSSAAKIKKMGIADATAVARYFGLSKKDGSVSYKSKGTIVKYIGEGWYTKKGKVYYEISKKKNAKGWMKIDGNWSLFNSKGQATIGFYTESKGARKGTYYFKKNGKSATGWVKIKKQIYHFYKNGKATTGMCKITVKKKQYTYLFDETGKLLTGWYEQDGSWYYFDESNGRMVSNQKAYDIDGVKYSFDKNGVCKTQPVITEDETTEAETTEEVEEAEKTEAVETN